MEYINDQDKSIRNDIYFNYKDGTAETKEFCELHDQFFIKILEENLFSKQKVINEERNVIGKIKVFFYKYEQSNGKLPRYIESKCFSC